MRSRHGLLLYQATIGNQAEATRENYGAGWENYGAQDSNPYRYTFRGTGHNALSTALQFELDESGY